MLRSVYSRTARASCITVRKSASATRTRQAVAIRSLSACHTSSSNTRTASIRNNYVWCSRDPWNDSRHLSSYAAAGQQQHQQRRSKVFVSRHNNSLNVTSNAILEYCNAHNIDTSDHRSSMTHVILKECPFCPKPTNDKADNFYKFYLQIGGGAYFCHRCGGGGSWYDFKSTVGGYSVESMHSDNTRQNHSHHSSTTAHSTAAQHSLSTSTTPTTTPLPVPQPRLSGYYSSRLLDPQNENNEVLKYLLEERGLDRKTLRKYGVGRASYKFPSDQGGYETAECVTFPWIMRQQEVQTQEDLRGASFEKKKETSKDEDKLLTRRIKVRAVHNKSWQRLDPAGGGWGLFGWHTVSQDCKEIVLTEGEYDAMAVHQATNRPAVSLPNGCRSLPVQVLPLLEKFDKIYIWMDSDQPGQEGAEKFAKKLGMNRCYIVKTNQAKDANEALLQKLDLTAILDSASLVPHERILTFGDLRNDVLHELLQPDLYTGSPIPSLPSFTKLIKGFRRGELTVLTGPTGSGKTTFLGQISLDMAEQGINVLWGSFEVKNTRLLHKLLKQFARNPLPDHKQSNASELLGALADRFQNLPMHFMKFHGGSDVDEVLDAMEYAVYVNDVEHIILDNMQFMISRGSNNSKWDKFDVQDMAIEKFRKFATEHNVHLTLVVHPRKEDESSKLNISSFYGSAKATQEADTVLILQHDGRRKYIDVKKNRFDGTLGYSPLYFQAASGRYVETEGGTGDSGAPSQQPIQFNPPQHAWKKKAEPEEEIEGLENHWAECLGQKS